MTSAAIVTRAAVPSGRALLALLIVLCSLALSLSLDSITGYVHVSATGGTASSGGAGGTGGGQ